MLVLRVGGKVRKDTVVEVWKIQNYQQEMSAVTAAGFRALLSSPWYLNRISYGADWKQYYTCDPQNFTGKVCRGGSEF